MKSENCSWNSQLLGKMLELQDVSLCAVSTIYIIAGVGVNQEVGRKHAYLRP